MRLVERGDTLPAVVHDFLPLPTGSLTLTANQTASLMNELSCNICFEVPSAGDFVETPCCSRVTHRNCVVQATALTNKGDNKEKRHRCPWCRYGEMDRELFSVRGLMPAVAKGALAVALLGDELSSWNTYDMSPDMMKAFAIAGSDRFERDRDRILQEAAAARAAMAVDVAAEIQLQLMRKRGRGDAAPASDDDESGAVNADRRRRGARAETPAGAAASRAPATGWGRKYVPSIEELSQGVAVVALRPHPAPPPSHESLPALPDDATIVSALATSTDAELSAYIEYRLRAADGTLPAGVPLLQAAASADGGEVKVTDPVVPVAKWGPGAGKHVSLWIGLQDPAARAAPPSDERIWPLSLSLAHILLDPFLWAVEKLEDEVLVVYYALQADGTRNVA